MFMDILMTVIPPTILTIGVVFLIFLAIYLLAIIFEDKEDYTPIIEECINSFKTLPEESKDQEVMKDIFRLLLSVKDDFELDLVFANRFNKLIGSTDFKLVMETWFVDNYFALEPLNRLKEIVDKFFTYREENIFKTDGRKLVLKNDSYNIDGFGIGTCPDHPELSERDLRKITDSRHPVQWGYDGKDRDEYDGGEL